MVYKFLLLKMKKIIGLGGMTRHRFDPNIVKVMFVFILLIKQSNRLYAMF